MGKYTQEIKDKALAAAKAGVSLKEIKATIGPNPKAVERYFKKAGLDYQKVREELKAKGLLKPSVNKNASVKAAEAKHAATKLATAPTQIAKKQ